MTTLTKQMRTEIVNSVLAGTNLPMERDEIAKATVLAAEDAVRNAQPEAFRELVEGQPKDWFKLDNSLYVRECNPLAELQRVTSEYHSHYISYNAPIPYAVQPNFDEADCKRIFGKLHKRAEAWAERYNTARGELSAFLNSQRTVEGVLEKMPELAPHIPAKAAKSYPLVAPSNLLSTLAKLGFDRTVKATAGEEVTA